MSGELLFGLQILVGSILILIGTQFGFKAVSYDAHGGRRDSAFGGYVFGCLVFVFIGTLLILLVGVTAQFVL